MKPSEMLRRAAERISPAGAWCQGAAAYDESGERVDATHPQACRWCVAGALIAEGSPLKETPEDRYIDRALGLHDDGHAYVEWNDNPVRTQSEVVEALRKAADLAESEGQ